MRSIEVYDEVDMVWHSTKTVYQNFWYNIIVTLLNVGILQYLLIAINADVICCDCQLH